MEQRVPGMDKKAMSVEGHHGWRRGQDVWVLGRGCGIIPNNLGRPRITWAWLADRIRGQWRPREQQGTSDPFGLCCALGMCRPYFTPAGGGAWEGVGEGGYISERRERSNRELGNFNLVFQKENVLNFKGTETTLITFQTPLFISCNEIFSTRK